MDNQQPSLKKRKVQRLSPKGVLKYKANIIWETPSIDNKIYLYFLQVENIVRYVGITNDPKRRLSHHINEIKTKKSYKNNWIKSCINKNKTIEMLISESFDLYDDALKKEEFYINTLPNLTNLELTPTKPNIKKCYVYDLKTEDIIEFKSAIDCRNFIKIKRHITYNKVNNFRYIVSKTNNFTKILNSQYKIKAINIKTKDVSYYMSTLHFKWKHNCSLSLITMMLNKKRKSCKGYILVKKGESFNEYKNKRINKILCITDNKVFNSAKEAGEYYNTDSSCIIKVCKGKRKKANNRIFAYYQ